MSAAAAPPELAERLRAIVGDRGLVEAAARAPYEVDEKRLPSAGLKMRCPKCGTSFLVRPPGGAVLGAGGGGYLLIYVPFDARHKVAEKLEAGGGQVGT